MSKQLCERCYNEYTDHEYCDNCEHELHLIVTNQIPYSPPLSNEQDIDEDDY